MTTAELIARLQEVDPGGEQIVCVVVSEEAYSAEYDDITGGQVYSVDGNEVVIDLYA